MRTAAFLDRDGVVNLDRDYVFRRQDFQFVPGTLDAARELKGFGLALVVITNQSGIASGCRIPTTAITSLQTGIH